MGTIGSGSRGRGGKGGVGEGRVGKVWIGWMARLACRRPRLKNRLTRYEKHDKTKRK